LNKLQESVHEFEAQRIDAALTQANGNLRIAAEALGIPKSTLATILQRKHPVLLQKSRQLRAHCGNERGRPRSDNASHDMDAVLAAWSKSGEILAVAARDLKIPASTLRDLLVRYKILASKKP